MRKVATIGPWVVAVLGFGVGCQHAIMAPVDKPPPPSQPLTLPPASPPPTKAAAPFNTGLILLAKATGDVTLKADHDSSRAVRPDDRIPNRATIVSGANSHAVLVFSNGNTLQLGAETTLTIDDYNQEPFAQVVKVAEIIEEPSVSQTRLQLLRGTLVGHIKRLKVDRGSSFHVETPVGQMKPVAAGGVFHLEFRPTATGQALFELSSGVGEFVFNAAEDPTKAIRVPEGQKISINVSVTTAPDGRLRITVPVR